MKPFKKRKLPYIATSMWWVCLFLFFDDYFRTAFDEFSRIKGTVIGIALIILYGAMYSSMAPPIQHLSSYVAEDGLHASFPRTRFIAWHNVQTIRSTPYVLSFSDGVQTIGIYAGSYARDQRKAVRSYIEQHLPQSLESYLKKLS